MNHSSTVWAPAAGVFAPEHEGYLRELAGSFGVDFLREMFDDLCLEGRKRVDEMRRALAAGDRALLESASHRMGSMLLSMGFVEMGATCRRVESIAEASAGGDAAALVEEIGESFAAVAALRRAL